MLLFAVGSPELASRRYTIEGRRVQAIRFGRLALLLGYVDQAAYASEELERRRDGLPFLRTEARIHERAVERASALGAVANGVIEIGQAHASGAPVGLGLVDTRAG